MDNNEDEMELMYNRQSDNSQNWFEIRVGPNAVMLKLYVKAEDDNLELPDGTLIKPEVIMDYDATIELAVELIRGASEAYRLDIDG